jgi:hypothetical protein
LQERFVGVEVLERDEEPALGGRGDRVGVREQIDAGHVRQAAMRDDGGDRPGPLAQVVERRTSGGCALHGVVGAEAMGDVGDEPAHCVVGGHDQDQRRAAAGHCADPIVSH